MSLPDGGGVMLEFDDLQHIVVTRVPALTGRYEFLSFRQPAQGRAWLAGYSGQGCVGSAGRERRSNASKDGSSVAFTWQGLRALGVDEQSLATFPRRIPGGHGRTRRSARSTREGIVPINGLAVSPVRRCTRSPFFSRAMRLSASVSPANTSCSWQRTPGVEVLSSLDLDGIPPFDYAHEHFGYRDRLSEPQIEGSGIQPTPGSGAPVKAGEFILGHVDESGEVVPLPKPEVLSRNGTFMAYRRLQEHVGAFPRLPAPAWWTNSRRPRIDRGEVDGTLAERSSARSGARQGRSSTWR